MKLHLNAPVLVLHFETSQGGDFSAEMLPIPVYVHDPRFAVCGLATMHPDGRTEFRADAGAAIKELQQRFGQHLEKALVVMHNARLGAFVLRHRFGVSLRNIVDTLSLLYLVHGPAQPAGLAELAKLYGLPRRRRREPAKVLRTPTAVQLGRLSAYAIQDVETIRHLFDANFPLAMHTPQEITIAAHTVRMFVEKPFAVDARAAEEGRTLLEKHVGDLVAATGHDRAAIAGNNSFTTLMGAALARTGRSIPLKPGKKGPIPAFAVRDEPMAALMSDDDDVVKGLAQARRAVQLAPSLVGQFGFLEASAAACGGSVHFELIPCGACTGRFAGGGGLNIQNLPYPNRLFGELEQRVATLLRKAIGAHPGHVLVNSDAAQIEARVVAWLAPEPTLHRAFSAGEDPYCSFASEVFGREIRIPAVDAPDYGVMTAMRAAGKTAVLALAYGMGPETFTARLRQSAEARALFDNGVLTPEVCRDIVAGYRQTFAAIPDLWHCCERAFHDAIAGAQSTVSGVRFFKAGLDVLVELPSGRRLRYPRASLQACDCPAYRQIADADEHSNPDPHTMRPVYAGRRADCDVVVFGGKLVNHIASGIARDILVNAILRLERSGWPVVLHCHDAIVSEVPLGRKDACADALIEAWREVPSWAPGLVLDAKTNWGRTLLFEGV